MCNDEVSVNKDLRTSQIQGNDQDVKQVMASISSFTNPFCSDVNPNELYRLSSGVPAKPDVTNDLLKAQEIAKCHGHALLTKVWGFMNPSNAVCQELLSPVKSQRK